MSTEVENSSIGIIEKPENQKTKEKVLSIEEIEFEEISDLRSEQIDLFKSEILKLKEKTNQKIEFSKYTKLCQFCFGLNCQRKKEINPFELTEEEEQLKKMIEILWLVDGSPSPRKNAETAFYNYIKHELNKVLVTFIPSKKTNHLLVRIKSQQRYQSVNN